MDGKGKKHACMRACMVTIRPGEGEIGMDGGKNVEMH